MMSSGDALARPRAAQQLAAAVFVLADLGERDLDVFALLFELAPVLAEHGEKGLQLRRGIGWRVVQIDELFDFLQRQPEALAAQRELQARAVALGVDAVAAGSGASRPTSS
jgi:hypothetical protein